MDRRFTETVHLTTQELMQALQEKYPNLPYLKRIHHRDGYLSVLATDDPTDFVFEGTVTKEAIK